MSRRSFVRPHRSALLLLSLFMVACASTTPEPVTTAAPPAAVGDGSLKDAASQVAADLATQLGPARQRTIAIDPLLDRTTGQQTAASSRAQDEVSRALTATLKDVTLEPFKNLKTEPVGLVASGSLGTVTPPDRYVLTVALTDRATGMVVAQSAARFREVSLDATPTAFYSDSPSLVRDRSVDGYLKTVETPKGTLADPLYVEQLPTAALLASALEEYNAGRWESALAGYTAAAGRTDGQTLRTFNGLYLANIHLKRTAEAEAAFGKIVALGLSTNNLAVKLLFRPGTTEFVTDPTFSDAYPMWLRQIARGANSNRSCLSVVGHTSASGTAAVNDPLSVSRAQAVKARLVREVSALEPRLTVKGVGSRQNIVGTGADDASDAVDRRVEFGVEACPR